jgi:hypothetical protein
VKEGRSKTMARWSYKASIQKLSDVIPESERVIHCDDKGSCLVHDIPEENLESLKRFLDEEGNQGWELIQCHYHAGDLFCLWKKQEQEA